MTNPEGHTLCFNADAIDDGALKLVRMRGREAVSELYDFELILANDDLKEPLGFDQAQALLDGSTMQVEFAGDGGALCGMIRSLEYLPAIDLTRSTYRARVVPRLWLTTQSSRSAIYQEIAVPEIIELVLARAGLATEDYELRLSGQYAPREYVVQYDETDFNFISRLMEDEGISYRFEHEAGGAGERLILMDANEAAGEDPNHDAIRYIPKLMESPEGGAMQAFTCRHKLCTSRVIARDYVDQQAPTYVVGERDASEGGPALEVTRYGGSLVDATVANHRAQVEVEGHLARTVVFRGDTTCAWLRSGYRVDVDDYSEGGLHPDFACALLVTSVEHDWDENQLYRNTFTAIDSDTPYRAKRRAARPRIAGVIHGRVVGEAPGSELPWLDDQGRYLVQLLFPNEGEPRTQVSRYIRMAQPLAGASPEGSYGIHFPLHAGAEVIVAHHDGDPDRPVIVGALPNPNTVSPVTSANSSHSIIQTRSGIVMAFVDQE
ncbi:MAG: type VI secretion system tip protein VgrG [Myxococcales bacterium]|nr:type VI secretion system tip protein VgrG [Myxococcales bacterium]